MMVCRWATCKISLAEWDHPCKLQRKVVPFMHCIHMLLFAACRARPNMENSFLNPSVKDPLNPCRRRRWKIFLRKSLTEKVMSEQTRDSTLCVLLLSCFPGAQCECWKAGVALLCLSGECQVQNVLSFPKLVCALRSKHLGRPPRFLNAKFCLKLAIVMVFLMELVIFWVETSGDDYRRLLTCAKTDLHFA